MKSGIAGPTHRRVAHGPRKALAQLVAAVLPLPMLVSMGASAQDATSDLPERQDSWMPERSSLSVPVIEPAALVVDAVTG